MGCFTWMLLAAGVIFLMVSLIRWFEQIIEAVRRGWWSKTCILVAMPLAVWFYPSRVAAGRPMPALPHRLEKGAAQEKTVRDDEAASRASGSGLTREDGN